MTDRRDMSRQYFLWVAAAVAGLASGPVTVASATASQPPVSATDLPWVAVAVAVGMFALFGLQAALGRTRALRWGWVSFRAVALYFVFTGLSGWAIAAWEARPASEGLLYCAVGAGLVLGLGAVKIVFGRLLVKAVATGGAARMPE